MAPLDPEAVADALAALGDVPEWRLPAPRWDRVASILEAMAEARDTAGLMSATIALERAGPPRDDIPLGSTPTVPPPPRLHLLQGRLVVALSSMSPPPLPVLPPRPDTATDGLVKQYLVVHAFAPATESGHARIRQLWDGCGSVLGMTRPIDALGLPVSLPPVFPGSPAIAARRSEHAQAIVRREHDVVVLSVAVRAPDTSWAALAASWQEVGGGGDDGRLIAIVTIFAGTVDAAPDAAIHTVAGALPPTVDDFWQVERNVVGAGTLWQLPPFGDGRRRRLVVLAPAGRDAELSALVWSRGDTALTPLTQYLLHASTAYYEKRVRDEVVLLPAGRSRIEELADAVEAAGRNMSRSLRAAGLPADPTGAPLGDDFTAVATLGEQLELDRRAARRATAGPHPQPTIGLVTVLPEEFAAMSLLLDGLSDWAVAGDRAVYRRGVLPSADPDRPHEVVLTMLTEPGTDTAAHGEAHLVRSFPSVDQVVMVGIAAGVPRPGDPGRHVRLGDIVAGTWNVVDFDNVVDRPDGPERRQEFPRRGALLASRVKVLAADELLDVRPWESHLDRLIGEAPGFARPDQETDVLFSGDDDFARPVPHPDPASTGHRPGRPKVHEGRIGSSDRSLRSAADRDRYAQRHNLRAIEMEGKGIGRGSHADGRDWLVVRGISDYGDSWTTSTWRRYAAAAAAAYVRALLAVCPPVGPHGGRVGGSAPADP